MDDPVIYTEESARTLCEVALRTGAAATLLNGLANGGAVTIDYTPNHGAQLVMISSEQVEWLASGGERGHQ